MHFSVAVVLLMIGNAIVSAQNCVELPKVPNAQPLDRQDAYVKGDILRFSCETGYTSGRQIKYICTDEGWISIAPSMHNICRLKPCVLPDDIPNGYYQIITGNDFVFGATIKYFCNAGYQMASREDTRTCHLTEWSNHLPVCEPVSCDAPPPTPGVSVQGLPSEESLILPDRFLTFSCDNSSSKLNGSATLICGLDGNWDKPFPNCVEGTCDLPASNPKLRVTGAEAGLVAAGGFVTAQCEGGSSKQLQCLPSGQWSPAFPTCRDSCDVGQVPDSVGTTPHGVKQRRIGQSLTFYCKTRGHVLQGEKQVTCLEDGRWNHPFPSCADPQSCGSPPPLDNGDFIGSSGTFGHNSRVQYQCQAKYTMQGGPYKTCLNGVWTGDIKCLKPCTVDSDLMEPNKIQFRFSRHNKVYAHHNDYISFTCVAGATHDGAVEMRQICLDGVVNLPKCV